MAWAREWVQERARVEILVVWAREWVREQARAWWMAMGLTSTTAGLQVSDQWLSEKSAIISESRLKPHSPTSIFRRIWTRALQFWKSKRSMEYQGRKLRTTWSRTCGRCLLLSMPGSNFLCASRPCRTCEVWVRECISCVRVALHAETIRPSVLILIKAKSATLQLVGTRFSIQ